MNKIELSVDDILKKYKADQSHVDEVLKYSLSIYDSINSLVFNFEPRAKELLSVAAKLHDIGYFIEKRGHHKHSLALIMSENISGFSEEERLLIANIARYHRNSFPDDVKHEFFAILSHEQKNIVSKLAAILRLADGLDKPHKNLILRMRATSSENNLKLILKTIGYKPDLRAANEKKDLLEHVLGKNVILEME